MYPSTGYKATNREMRSEKSHAKLLIDRLLEFPLMEIDEC